MDNGYKLLYIDNFQIVKNKDNNKLITVKGGRNV